AVHHVLGGAEALELLTRRPPPDLLIADLGMPGMNGLQLAAAARRLYPGLTILIATGYAAQEADDRGSHDLPVLSKPFKAADLLGRVAELLAEARPGGAPSRATVPDLPRSLAGTG
ncbi:MAG: response regulator, partial [Rhodospirillales bacterium]|nr:response regulator [Rhodospirillales bacterium]